MSLDQFNASLLNKDIHLHWKKSYCPQSFKHYLKLEIACHLNTLFKNILHCLGRKDYNYECKYPFFQKQGCGCSENRSNNQPLQTLQEVSKSQYRDLIEVLW